MIFEFDGFNIITHFKSGFDGDLISDLYMFYWETY